MTEVSLSDAKDRLSALVKETAETTGHIAISVHGRKQVMLISVEEYDSLMETIEILKDQNLVQKIDGALKEMRQGELVDFDDIKENI